MLNITFSNRFEALLAILLGRMAEPPESPFTTEQIVIPSAAMRRKLELAIADRFGICSNTAFSFLRSWVSDQTASGQDGAALLPEILTWRIFRIFEDESFVSAYPRLSSWLGKADGVMRYDLAQQLAVLIGQYLLYRPHWLKAWSSQNLVPMPKPATAMQDQAWQAALWRRIVSETGLSHGSPIATDYKLQSGQTAHVFCPPEIAPQHIEILRQLGQSMDLHLYLLNPCREFWFDIVDPRRLGYLKARGQADYQETGNRLLACWGKQTQALLGLLFADETLASDEASLFLANREAGSESLLAQVQDAILDLVELHPGSIELPPDDRSIEIHVCHSLTRELEVLQDQLLALFAGENPPLTEDVLVVTPDLQQAAPLIDAVFGTAQAARRIPYTIAGRKGSRENPVAIALLDLLSLAPSRFAASAVFNLLQQTVIARRFGLDQADLDAIHGWMAESGIRWGLDGTHRQQLGLPESERYSFSDGLHRLFLGYALPSGSQAPFGQRLPAGNPEGSAAAALGSLQQFMRQLADLQRNLREPKTADEWMQSLLSLSDQFMRPINNELDDWREVQRHVRELCEQMQLGGEQHPISLDVMQTALTAQFDQTAWASVPTGMVTFTSIGGLRNLPYKIVCAIGLNDGSFPTTRRPAEFDLMAISQQPGDRQRRNDERNLFLDLLLAARERLYLSYTGHNVRDNSPLPPSVLIADLLDYLLPAIGSADAHARLVIEHPLQPFSEASFQHDSNPRILSSNGEYHQALKQKLLDPLVFALPTSATGDEDGDDDETNDENALSFFREPLPPPGDEWREVSLDQLLRFFRNPSRFLLQQRLGVAFPEKQEELLDDEPFLPDRDEKNTLADRLLPLYLNGASQDAILASAIAGTEYPPGELGQSLLEQELRALDAFAQKWRLQTSQPPLPPVSKTLEFSIDGETWRLTGAFGDLRPDGLIRCRFDDVRPTDYLAGWIAHLFLNAMAPDGVKPQTVWHSRDGQYTLKPTSDAREQLQKLLTLYRKGLSAPLHFYPKSAWEYACKSNDLSKANLKWRGGKNEEFSESHDPSYRQALRGIANPLDADFETCAQTVFQPLLTHIDDPRLDT